MSATILDRKPATSSRSVPMFKYALVTSSRTRFTDFVSLSEVLKMLEALRVHNPSTSVCVTCVEVV